MRTGGLERTAAVLAGFLTAAWLAAGCAGVRSGSVGRDAQGGTSPPGTARPGAGEPWAGQPEASPAGRAASAIGPHATAGTGPAPVDPVRVHALLVNGGGDRATNYQSHAIHLRAMLAALSRAGVPRENITVLASDGADPATDLAVLERRDEPDAWLLDGTRAGGRLLRPIEYVSTEIDGVEVRPATRESLRESVRTIGDGLRPGDTLLLFVTDHGTKGKEDGAGNRITLWGRDQTISAAELDELLAGLDPGVRTVAVMSQCYSGGFAQLGRSPGDDLPTGRACGYFSTTADRQAYGCHPENRGAADVGHAVRFIEALDATGDLAASQARVLVADRTPDVPLASSDVALERLLAEAARRDGRTLAELADELLREAAGDPGAWQRERRLLDATAQGFGLASPRSVGEVDRELAALRDVAQALSRQAKAWEASLDDLAEANLGRFLAAHPGWRAKLEAPALQKLDPAAARALGGRLIAELGPFTRSDGETWQRLLVLRERAQPAQAVSYRLEAREAAALRMRALLIGAAGRVYVATRATAREREALGALATCEVLTLAAPPRRAGPPALDLIPEAQLPPHAEDLRLAEQLRPGWIGISFAEPKPELRAAHGLEPGAVEVREVLAGSPAARAGLEVGDVVLGPSGSRFTEPRQVREWTMLWPAGEPTELEILRDGRVEARMIVPVAHPGKLPEGATPPSSRKQTGP